MTRLARLPTPAFEEKVYTAQEDELRKVRHRLSLCAARVGMKGVSLAQTIGEVEGIVEALRAIGVSVDCQAHATMP